MQVDGAGWKGCWRRRGTLVSSWRRAAYARLSEARLKPLGFGVGYLPVLVALKNGRADTQRDLARLRRWSSPQWRKCLSAWSEMG